MFFVRSSYFAVCFSKFNIFFLKCCILQGLSNGINIRWGLFMPNGSAMKAVAKLVDEGKVIKLYL